MIWQCDICGYEMEGSAPVDICPVCGVDKSHFFMVAEETGKPDLDAVKSSIRQISYGMFVITTKSGDKINGQTANTVVQLTSDPNQIAVCMNKNNYTTELVLESGKLAVHIIGMDGFDVVANFGYSSGRDRNKFELFRFKERNGLPILEEYALSGMFCHVVQKLDVGTHMLFVCKVDDAFSNISKKNVDPMTYGDFRILKSGKKVVKKMEAQSVVETGKNKYICSVCGYVYDPDVEGIPFEELPDSYVCPLCGAPKSDFDLLK